MSIYRKVCYKVENFLIKRISKSECDFKVNMERAGLYRETKEAKKLKKKNSKKIKREDIDLNKVS
ncbi:MAG: hypothetical protein RRZ84_05835 [Romboutsia sp.]